MGYYRNDYDPSDDPRYSGGGRPQGGGGGFSGRLIGAAIIAVIALFMYLSQVQVNPVTGERQHVSLSPNQEIKLGLESAPEMSRQMGGELPSSDPRVIEVRKLGQYLVENTDAKKSPWKFQFHVLGDTETVNAFALPGGQIFITEALYDKLQNEAQLAGVLSHEMGHVIERHTAQQMAKNQFGQMLVVAVGAAASDSQQNGLLNPTAIASIVNNIIQLRYSRHDESEADRWGIMLMSQVGYDPTAMIEVMEILKKVGGSRGGPEMFQTHPNPDLRIEQIKEYLKEHPPQADLNKGKVLREFR